jgi:hypothetical protein
MENKLYGLPLESGDALFVDFRAANTYSATQSLASGLRTILSISLVSSLKVQFS